MRKNQVDVITLGCSKNLVDSEQLIRQFLANGYVVHHNSGAVNGEITLERSGDHGFGYDPVFRPEGCQQTFAELSSEEKNAMSHRGRAVQRLARYLYALPLDE